MNPLTTFQETPPEAIDPLAPAVYSHSFVAVVTYSNVVVVQTSSDFVSAPTFSNVVALAAT